MTTTFTIMACWRSRTIDNTPCIRAIAQLPDGTRGDTSLPLIEYTYLPGDRITFERDAEGYVIRFHINDGPWIPQTHDHQTPYLEKVPV